jgi:hypothetical protein
MHLENSQTAPHARQFSAEPYGTRRRGWGAVVTGKTTRTGQVDVFAKAVQIGLDVPERSRMMVRHDINSSQGDGCTYFQLDAMVADW